MTAEIWIAYNDIPILWSTKTKHMKKSEVPQDKSNLSEHNIKEICYAVDDSGNYGTALSSGWEAKTIIQKQTIDSINQRIEEAQQKVRQGEASPILYFMELHKMDWQILSGYVGMWQWRVKRHIRPDVFKKMNYKLLNRYAEAFDITIEELQNYKGE